MTPNPDHIALFRSVLSREIEALIDRGDLRSHDLASALEDVSENADLIDIEGLIKSLHQEWLLRP